MDRDTYVDLYHVAPIVVEFSLKLKYIWQILVQLNNIRFLWKSVEHFLAYMWMDKHGKAMRCICVAFHCEYAPPPLLQKKKKLNVL